MSGLSILAPPCIAGQAPPSTATLQVPIYDFKVSKRVGYKTVKVPVSRVVIVEGIYALSARIRCGISSCYQLQTPM